MAPKYEIRRDKQAQTIYFQVTGSIDLATMKQIDAEYRRATDAFYDRQHVVLADMRGLQPMVEEVASVLGGMIGYGRAHGAVRCAHLSDHVVQKLQAARLARQSTPGDTVTVDVVSVQEAERVLDEARAKLQSGAA
ncbi:MAG TPA: hypothetical protein VFH51_12910 [Myxococcota bacterium]|nr:hypothetical protein [Myxococcota bacterium]